MSAHTPGPWQVSKRRAYVGTMAMNVAAILEPNREANAALIAAAPDLLAACQEFVRKVECGEAKSKRSYTQMVAAIAKAQS